MRHKLKGRKLNRTSSHRNAMFANLAASLVVNEQIKTTLAKAKELRRFVEPLITKAKQGDLSARRRIISKIRDQVAAEKLMSILSSRYKKRNGGYTRIIKDGFRKGDAAPVAYIEFVDRDVEAKGTVKLADLISRDKKMTDESKGSKGLKENKENKE